MVTPSDDEPVPVAAMTADLHLGRQAWANRPGLWGDAYWGFEQICNFAIRHRLPAILAAGDLLDTKQNDSGPIEFFCRQLDRLTDAEVDFLYIQGDHEKTDPPWPSIHTYAGHIHKLGVNLPAGRSATGEEAFINVYGLDYQPSGKLQAELDQIPDNIDILVCHQKWTNQMGGQAICNGSWSEISGVNLVLTGDLHKHQIGSGKGKQGQPLTVWSPGATCKQSIDEPDEHRFFVLYNDFTVRHVKLRSRQVRRTQVLGTEADLDAFLQHLGPLKREVAAASQTLPEQLRKGILEVRYYVDVPNAAYRIWEAVGEDFHLFEQQYLRDTPQLTIERQERQSIIDEGLVGALRHFSLDDSTRDRLQRLLEAGDDVRGELTKQREEFGLT